MLDEMEDLKTDRDASISEATRAIEKESQSALELAQATQGNAISELNSAADALEALVSKLNGQNSSV